MNEWVILFINYMLYSINNLLVICTNADLLTPKYSRLKTILIWYGVLTIGATIKFFMPVYAKSNMGMAYVNIVVSIIVSYLLCKEGIWGCILAFWCVNMVSVLSCMVWIITPYAEATNWEIGTTIGYLISTPVMIVGFLLMMWGKRLLFGQRDFEISGRIATLILFVSLYYVMFSYIPMWLEISTSINRETIILIMEVFGVLVYVIILYMILKKSEEIRYFQRSKELELARIKEQDIYDELVQRMEYMEKIRHDFYGQLTVARHIVNQDREKGMQMIKELEEQLGIM